MSKDKNKPSLEESELLADAKATSLREAALRAALCRTPLVNTVASDPAMQTPYTSRGVPISPPSPSPFTSPTRGTSDSVDQHTADSAPSFTGLKKVPTTGTLGKTLRKQSQAARERNDWLVTHTTPPGTPVVSI